MVDIETSFNGYTPAGINLILFGKQIEKKSQKEIKEFVMEVAKKATEEVKKSIFDKVKYHGKIPGRLAHTLKNVPISDWHRRVHTTAPYAVAVEGGTKPHVEEFVVGSKGEKLSRGWGKSSAKAPLATTKTKQHKKLSKKQVAAVRKRESKKTRGAVLKRVKAAVLAGPKRRQSSLFKDTVKRMHPGAKPMRYFEDGLRQLSVWLTSEHKRLKHRFNEISVYKR